MTHHTVRTAPARRSVGTRLRCLGAALLAATALAGCQVSDLSNAAHMAPVPSALERRIERMDMRVSSPILLRIFKEESQLEVWKEDRDGQFQRLKTYEICAWSGKLGPKLKEGDRQAPEGFYRVGPAQMHPKSSYHLAFNLGFPNTFDRSHGRTGSHLMVHGDCSSRGCYAMDDQNIEEIYALAREAFAGGQRSFQVQAFPFRMTPENLARHAESEHLAFWEMLKEGADHFEVTKRVPSVEVCDRRYVFNASAEGGRFLPSEACPSYTVDPQVEALVAAKREADLAEQATVVAKLSLHEAREVRWQEREAAIASFLDRARAEAEEGRAEATSPASVPTPITSTPVPTQPAPAPADAPVASLAGVATPSGAQEGAAQETVAEAPEPPVASTAEPPSALGFAPEDDGFLASVAKKSRGLFRRAGDLLE
ncbi:L,D-transpeptidase family protein [Acuticoccus sp.]|uniref:L,D-transpeptidase family protein n=1 Tax=Acuticoccus sp. TaxID=1904378 RepID=UPI003B526F7D